MAVTLNKMLKTWYLHGDYTCYNSDISHLIITIVPTFSALQKSWARKKEMGAVINWNVYYSILRQCFKLCTHWKLFDHHMIIMKLTTGWLAWKLSEVYLRSRPLSDWRGSPIDGWSHRMSFVWSLVVKSLQKASSAYIAKSKNWLYNSEFKSRQHLRG